MSASKLEMFNKRKKRVRNKILESDDRPRLSVFRSSKYIYGQIIKESEGKTLVSVSIKDITEPKEKKLTKTETSKLMGMKIAEKAKEKNIIKVVFDRGAYKYHGRVKAFAEGAREGGLNF